MERWLGAIRAASPELRTVGVVVRPHPQNADQWQNADLSRYGDVAIWPRAGAQPDVGGAMDDFYDTLSGSRAVVGINTSALIEAGIVGKSVYTVADDEFKGTQEGTLHFHYLLAENGGFVYMAPSLEEHAAQPSEAFSSSDADRQSAQTRSFIRRFCRPHGLDVAAAPLVAAAIEELALAPRTAARRAGADARRLRLALYPLAALTSLAAMVVTAFRWSQFNFAVKVLRRTGGIDAPVEDA